ncbi:amino acid ABC transporter substrate-binding protein [Duganella sp. FT27W]|uniref:amino acid ABC transporter substrate-binding protein n=1 Tax=Duganella sp. FT27W TaxID=2654636 RepID=UPI00128B6392|nr:amino acid ABC transporter substrate-binding protein [Duganella sp. FT27W]MPQ60341.1 transporter substrate-binding domain-containing protein [Duganella sp. FT27W]
MSYVRIAAIVTTSAALAVSATASAQDPGGTLAKIKRTNTITLGVRDGSIPFSFLDDRQRYQGYSIDLCMKIVAAVQKHLNMSGLKVVTNPVTAANRIPLMANGTIDLECGSTTNNAERQKQVAFAPTMFVIANRLLTKKSSNIGSLADMKGKTLVATAGTTTHKQMTMLNAERKLGMKILVGKDHPESFLMLETSRAVAEANDDILLAGQVATARNPDQYVIGTEALSVEPYGIMLRRGDPKFKAVVDSALTDLYRSDEFPKIYAKWFTSAIPPRGINLNFPMSAQLKAAIAKPTDSPDPAAYAVK